MLLPPPVTHPKRIVYIDCLKGFAILLVVIGHVLDGYLSAEMYPSHQSFMELCFHLIYAFHMPLFFIISGFVYYTAYFDNKGYCKKKKVITQIYNLFSVYVLFSAAYGVFKIALSRFTNNNVSYIDIFLILIKTIAPYWYLYVLIAYYFFFSFLKLNKKSMALLFCGLLFVSICSYFVEGRVGTYFEIKRIAYYAVYFFFGMMLRSNIYHVKYSKLFAFGMFLIAIALMVVCYIYDFTDYSSIFLVRNVIAFGISINVIMVFQGFLDNETNFMVRFLHTIGQYSLEIYVIHCVFTAGNRVILPKLHITNFWLNLPVNVILSTAIPILFAVICKRIHIHGYIFRPATMIAKKKEEKLKCTTI